MPYRFTLPPEILKPQRVIEQKKHCPHFNGRKRDALRMISPLTGS